MNTLYCPKCGSSNVHITEKGYSAKKGIFGLVALGGIGLLAGLHGNKDALCICLSCNKKFKPSESGLAPLEHKVAAPQNEQIAEITKTLPTVYPSKTNHVKSQPPKVTQRVRCKCGAWNCIYNKTCFSCDGKIDLVTMSKSNTKQDGITICECEQKNSISNKYCISCGIHINYNKYKIMDDKTVKYSMYTCRCCSNDTPAPSRRVKHCCMCGCILEKE